MTDFAHAFPRAIDYRSLAGSATTTVRENTAPPRALAFTERHLQCVWYDNALRPAVLQADDGETVTVLSAGRWNFGAGPDFSGAILEAGPDRRRLEGDVEIHIHPSAWQGHGHDSDPAYRNVVAHVCYFPGRCPPGALPPGTRQIALKTPLETRPGFSFEAIDVAAYPYAQPRPGTTPCAGILADWDNDERGRLLEIAGEERLRLKALRLQDRAAGRGADQLLYEEILRALGYRKNQAAFSVLGERVRLEALRTESGGDATAGYALLLGVAGLLPNAVSDDPETRDFVRQLWDAWWRLQSRWQDQVLPASLWHLSSVRPQNHPLRRLGAAAALFTPRDLLSCLSGQEGGDPRARVAAARAMLAAARLPYWDRRLSLGTPPGSHTLALIGPERTAAILVNVVLPWLAAAGADVRTLLAELPAEHPSRRLTDTAFLLFGRDHNPLLYRTGLRQQGLLQVFHDFCLNRRPDCDGCRFAEALGRIQSTGR